MKLKVAGFAKLVVSITLIAYLLSIVDFGSTLDRLKSLDIRFVVIALFLSVGQVAISAAKWKLILHSDGLNAPYLLLLKSYYIGNFIGLFLPSGFGGDVYRVIALTNTNQKLGRSTSSVLFDRLTGLFALLSIALIAYVALPGREYDAAAVALYVAGILVFLACTTDTAIAKLKKSNMSIVTKLSVLLVSFQTYRQDYKILWKVMAIALFFQFMIVVINKLYATALFIDISFAKLLFIVPLVFLTEVLPISINGIGVRDSAFVYFFVMMGHAKEEGLAIALLVLAMRYTSGLVGGSVLLISVLHQHFLKRQTATR